MSAPPVQVARNDLEFPNLLLDWSTPPLGQVILKLEISNVAKHHIAYSDNVAIQVDNTAPTVNVNQLAWKFVGEPDSALRNLFGIPCPKIPRGAIPKDIELVFEVSVSANHLRDSRILTHGCGSGDFMPILDPLNRPNHWYVNGLDNSVVLHQRYKLDHTALEGSYWFYCHAHTRAMNPSGADGGNHLPTPDWNFDPDGYIWVEPWYAIAVINRD
jgi:hypothetical protein